jgi:hypothetical protein
MIENINKIPNTEEENYLFHHISENAGKMHDEEWLDMLHQLVEPIHNGRRPYCMEECSAQMLLILDTLTDMFIHNFSAGKDGMASYIYDIIDPLYNTTVSGLIVQQFDKACECLTHLANMSVRLRIGQAMGFKCILKPHYAVTWLTSDHKESSRSIMLTYLDDMDYDNNLNMLPELFVRTDLFAEDYFWNANLSLRKGIDQRVFATAAAIQHLKYGKGVMLENVFPILAEAGIKKSPANHAYWISTLLKNEAIIDPERTRQFFTDYCEYMVTVAAKTNPLILKTMGKLLDEMCDDRSMTYNAFSKRFFIEIDMGYSL